MADSLVVIAPTEVLFSGVLNVSALGNVGAVVSEIAAEYVQERLSIIQ